MGDDDPISTAPAEDIAAADQATTRLRTTNLVGTRLSRPRVATPLAPASVAGLRIPSQSRPAMSPGVSVRPAEAIEGVAVAHAAASSAHPVPAPTPIGDLDFRRVTGRFTSSDFGRIRIGFEYDRTRFDWADRLGDVNSGIFQFYFRTPQNSEPLPVQGVDNTKGMRAHSKWGVVSFQIDSLTYSSRFGGSLRIRLLADEDIGPEIGDVSGGNNLIVDLRSWCLNLYIQPTIALFNNPSTAVHQITKHMFAELEVAGYEAYRREQSLLLPHSGLDTQTDESLIRGLCDAAAQEAVPRLAPLGLYILGFVHRKWLPDFSAIDERVTNLSISDNLCMFETAEKKPYIMLSMKTTYHGTGSLDGPLSGGPELTAAPSLSLYRTNDMSGLIFNNQLAIYLGSAASTGFRTMGFVGLEQFASAREMIATAAWMEADPLAYNPWHFPSISFSLEDSAGQSLFKLSDLNQRAEINELGLIADEFFKTLEDTSQRGLSYSIQIKLYLIKR